MDDFQQSCYDEAISRGYDDEAARQIVARVKRLENSANLRNSVELPTEKKDG